METDRATVNQGLRHLTKGLTDDEGVQANDKLVDLDGGGDRRGHRSVIQELSGRSQAISAPSGRKL